MTKVFTFQDRSSVIDFLERTKVVFPHGAELITTLSKFVQEETDQKDNNNMRMNKYVEGLYKHLFTSRIIGDAKRIANDGYFDENGDWCPQLEISFWNDTATGYTGKYMVKEDVIDMVIREDEKENIFNVWFGGTNGKDIDLTALVDLSVSKKSNEEVAFNEEVYNGEVKEEAEVEVKEEETCPSSTVEPEEIIEVETPGTENATEEEAVVEQEVDENPSIQFILLAEAKDGDLLMLGKSLNGVYFNSYDKENKVLSVYTTEIAKEDVEVKTYYALTFSAGEVSEIFNAVVPTEVLKERVLSEQEAEKMELEKKAEEEKQAKLQKLLDAGFTLDEIKELIK
jgi:hypothetical protein